jgi:hypothetical protein
MTRPRKILIGVLALAALGLGGAAIAGATGGDSEGSGSVPEAAKEAALKATGGGTLGASEQDGEKGAVYEVEVTRRDGKQVDVRLAQDLSVVAIDSDTSDADESADKGD